MSKRILVVDDEPNIREVICFALERAGMATTTARNGAEALRAVQREVPSLIVLDIGMPELDGLEVCRLLRRSSDVPVLFLSARDEEVDRIVGLELGGDDYVTKLRWNAGGFLPVGFRCLDTVSCPAYAFVEALKGLGQWRIRCRP